MLLFLLSFLCIFSATGVFANTKSPVSYSGSLSSTENWLSASFQCQKKASTLATVRDSHSESVLYQYLSQPKNNPSTVWIGLRLTDQSTGWRRIDGASLSHQGCYKYRTTEAKSEDNNKLTPSRCIYTCQSMGRKFASTLGGSICKCDSEESMKWVWTEGTPNEGCSTPCTGDSTLFCGGPLKFYLHNVHGVYSNWQRGEPTSQNGNCAFLDTLNDYRWYSGACSQKFSYICSSSRWSLSNFNKKAWRSVCFSSYKCFHIPVNKESDYLSWGQALRTCTRLHGTLASLNSSSEYGQLVRFIDNATNYQKSNFVANTIPRHRRYWIGVSKRHWVEHNQHEVIVRPYSRLSSSLIDLTATEMDRDWCAAVKLQQASTGQRLLTYVADSCSSSYGYVCERRNSSDSLKNTSDDKSTGITSIHIYLIMAAAVYVFLVIVCTVLICLLAPRRRRSSPHDHSDNGTVQHQERKTLRDDNKYYEVHDEYAANGHVNRNGAGYYNSEVSVEENTKKKKKKKNKKKNKRASDEISNDFPNNDRHSQRQSGAIDDWSDDEPDRGYPNGQPDSMYPPSYVRNDSIRADDMDYNTRESQRRRDLYSNTSNYSGTGRRSRRSSGGATDDRHSTTVAASRQQSADYAYNNPPDVIIEDRTPAPHPPAALYSGY